MACRSVIGGFLIDANLLCLLVVGRHDPRAIDHHPRLDTYDLDSFALLGNVIDRLGDPVLSSPVIAETANLLSFRQSREQKQFWRRALAEVIEMAREVNLPAIVGTKHPDYLRVGFTDAMLLVLAYNENIALISDDLALCIAAYGSGRRVINFNYLRDGAIRLEEL